MNNRFGTADLSVSLVHTTMVSTVIKTIKAVLMLQVILVLSGCNNSSESPNMNEPTVNITQLEDSAGVIAGLEFKSAEQDASYQCLLSAAQASATSRGMQASPVLDEDNPIGRGVYATWCKTVGDSEAVDTDLTSCFSHRVDDLGSPGTEALQLFANRERAPGNAIDQIELKSIKIPTQGADNFKVKYTRVIGVDVNFFGLEFIPNDGSTFNDDLSVSVGSNYAYIDSDDSVREYYFPDRTPAEQKNLLASSAVQFKTTVTTDLEALKVQVEQVVNNDNSRDTNDKQTVITKAITEIDRQIQIVDQNSETLHGTLVEQLSVEECGL